MTTFIDTSAWFAAMDAGDDDHARMNELLPQLRSLLTTDHVLVECWLMARRRLGRDVADRFVARLLEGGARIELVGYSDMERAVEIARVFQDQDFSFVDRTSFAVMERLGVSRVVALDDDFVVYRYGSRRRNAFEVLR